MIRPSQQNPGTTVRHVTNLIGNQDGKFLRQMIQLSKGNANQKEKVRKDSHIKAFTKVSSKANLRVRVKASPKVKVSLAKVHVHGMMVSPILKAKVKAKVDTTLSMMARHGTTIM